MNSQQHQSAIDRYQREVIRLGTHRTREMERMAAETSRAHSARVAALRASGALISTSKLREVVRHEKAAADVARFERAECCRHL